MTKTFSVAALLALATSLFGQTPIPFSAPGSVTETFDSLSNTGITNAFSNGITITGVFAFQGGGTAAAGAVTNYRADNGTSNAGSIYSFGATASTERAMGSIASGTPGNFAYGLVIQNTSVEPLDLSVAYTGEQWRNGGNVTPQTLQFSTRTQSTLPSALADWDPTVAVPIGYSAVGALTFTTPTVGATAGALDGNLPANQVVFPNTFVVTVQPNDFAILRWFDTNDAGNDHGMGIDGVTVVAVPEPATVLSIAGAGLGLVGVVRRRVKKARSAA